jgi:hypothetical protein
MLRLQMGFNEFNTNVIILLFLLVRNELNFEIINNNVVKRFKLPLELFKIAFVFDLYFCCIHKIFCDFT